MIVTRRMLLTVLLMLQPLMSATAEDDVLPEEQEIRRYTVEIIIFKYAQEVSTGSEVFPPDEPPPRVAVRLGKGRRRGRRSST